MRNVLGKVDYRSTFMSMMNNYATLQLLLLGRHWGTLWSRPWGCEGLSRL